MALQQRSANCLALPGAQGPDRAAGCAVSCTNPTSSEDGSSSPARPQQQQEQQRQTGLARPSPSSRSAHSMNFLTSASQSRTRERSALLRSISHLTKDEAPQANPKDEGGRHDTTFTVEVGDAARPFHHSEMAQPPMYALRQTGTVRSRLSLDVRRHRPAFVSAEEQQTFMAASSSSSNLGGRMRRSLHLSRSQLNLDTVHDATPPDRQSKDKAGLISSWRRKGLSFLHGWSGMIGQGFAQTAGRSPGSRRGALEANTGFRDMDHSTSAQRDDQCSHCSSISGTLASSQSVQRSHRDSCDGQRSLFDSQRSSLQANGSPASSFAAVQDTSIGAGACTRPVNIAGSGPSISGPSNPIPLPPKRCAGPTEVISPGQLAFVTTSYDQRGPAAPSSEATTVVAKSVASRPSDRVPGGGHWCQDFAFTAGKEGDAELCGERILSPLEADDRVVGPVSRERESSETQQMSFTAATEITITDGSDAAASQKLALPLQPAMTVHFASSLPSGSQFSGKYGTATGLDEEQEAMERSTNQVSADGAGSDAAHLASTSAAANASGSANPSSRRTARSSKLSQLPRLNSSSGNARTQGAGRVSGGDADGGSDDGGDARRRASMPSDDDSAGQETEVGDDTGTESDDDDDTMSMPGSLPLSRTGRTSSGFSSSEGRQSRRPSGIVLPPAPTFVHVETNDISPTSSSAVVSSSRHATDNATSFTTPTAFSSRAGWTQFHNDDTPDWLPTPRANAVPSSTGKSVAPALPPQTNRVGSNVPTSTPADLSYFAISPVQQPPPQSSLRHQNESNIPPPSPSIITRSRALSAATSRPLRTPTLPGREMPPMPPIEPLKLRTGDRAKSPSATTRKAIPPPIIAPPFSPSGAGALSTASQHPAQSTTQQQHVPPYPSLRTPKSAGSGRPSTSTAAITEGVPSATSPALRAQDQLLRPLASPGLLNGGTPANRPGLYKQESRSLIDLTSSARKQFEPKLIPLQRGARVPEVPQEVAKIERTASPAPSVTSMTTAPRRRRSMYEVGAAPPPYSSVNLGAAGPRSIVPREEEGREHLPKYGCSVHIEGYLPRKMEFSSPGVQAKDRSWRRQYFVLHGTCLRVYRTDLSSDKGAAKGAYGAMAGAHVHMEPLNEDGPTVLPGASQLTVATSRVQGVDGNAAVTKDVVESGTTSAAGTGSAPRHSPTSSMHTSSSGGGGGLQKTVEAALSGTISHINHPFSMHRSALVKQYTLQGAESGLAADYLKRRHVVRIRAEGEQFLLQTRNDRHVVDWIEAFQASTNIALDLERRPMPKFITLPRRRRRRRREGEQGAATATATGTAARNGSTANDLIAQEAADLAEARRRSLADAGGASPASSTVHCSIAGAGIGRAPPARPLGLPGDESPPNPSAAFEEMLREEHEGMAQRDAGDV